MTSFVLFLSCLILLYCCQGVPLSTDDNDEGMHRGRSKRSIELAVAAIGAIATLGSTGWSLSSQGSPGTGPNGGCVYQPDQGCTEEGAGTCPSQYGHEPVQTIQKNYIPHRSESRPGSKNCDPFSDYGFKASTVEPYTERVPLCCRGKVGHPAIWAGVWEREWIGTKFRCVPVTCPKGRSQCKTCGMQLKCSFFIGSQQTTFYDIVPNDFYGGRNECTKLHGASQPQFTADAQFGSTGKIDWFERGISGRINTWWKVQ